MSARLPSRLPLRRGPAPCWRPAAPLALLVLRGKDEVRAWSRSLRARGKVVALVPTMGFLASARGEETPPLEGGDNASSKAADQVPISRRNFVELCEKLTVEDEKKFEELWRTLGLSVDWSQTYRTISDDSQRTAQRAFLRNQIGRAHV